MKNVFDLVRKLRRKAGEKSIYAFAKLYLKHHLSYDPSKEHKKLYEILKDIVGVRGKKLAIAEPRGFGKSTMVTLALIIYCICYSKEKFIVILSHSASQARKILENVKDELVNNDSIRRDFPEIFETTGRPKPPKWRVDDILTKNGIEVLALGAGQRIRGRRHRTNRPTLVIGDDLEDDEKGVFNYEASEKIKRWFNKAVLHAGDEETNYILLGNLHHPYSLLADYLSADSYPEWIKRQGAAIVQWPDRMDLWEIFRKIRNFKDVYCDKTGPEAAKKYYEDNKAMLNQGAIILWPERWSLLSLMEKYDDNELSFMSEMQNKPKDISDIAFDVENFHYWSDRYTCIDAMLDEGGNSWTFYGACDPSMGKHRFKGDFSAIIVLGRSPKGTLYILEADIARKNSEKLKKDILAYYEKYKFVKFAFESNQCQELFINDIEKEGRERGLYIPIEPVVNKTDKIARIQSMYSWMKNGTIQFNKNHKTLLNECMEFPNCKHDDGLDALEMAVRMAEKYTTVNLEDRARALEQITGEYSRHSGVNVSYIDPYTGEQRRYPLWDLF